MTSIILNFRLKTATLIGLYVGLPFLFGMTEVILLLDDKWLDVMVVIELIISLTIVFYWYVMDTKNYSYTRTRLDFLKIAILGIIFLPYYFFKTRTRRIASLATVVFFTTIFLGMYANYAGNTYGYHLQQDGLSRKILGFETKLDSISKFQVQYRLIAEAGDTPYVYVDATKPGVVVPKSYVKDGKIVLNISTRAIHDFEWSDDKFIFSARFSGKTMLLTIPLTSVIELYAGNKQEKGVIEL